MKREKNNILVYLKKIASKWWTWTTTIALNVLALIAQIYIDIPQVVYLSILLFGFLVAGYQVYQDITDQLPLEKITPPPYELIPLKFTIDLTNQIPRIDVLIHVINYQSHELNLQSLTLTNFYINDSSLTIPNIDMVTQDLPIPPKQSILVRCYKYLIESEIKAIETSEYRLSSNSTFTAIPKANIKNKQIYYHLYYDRDKNYSISGEIKKTA